jgi:hypothetical protein
VIESPASVIPGAPAAPAVDSAAPRVSAVDQATEAARQRINTSGSALPAPAHHSQNQPRVADTGQFHKSAVKEVGADIEVPVEGADGKTKASPEAGQGAEGQEEAGAVREDQEGAERAAEGQEGAPATDEVDDDLIVALPPRNEGEDEVEIQVADKAVADRLRQLKNSALRGDEARQVLTEAQQAREQVEEFEDMLAADPGGVVVNALKDDPATMKHLAMFLLTRPEVWTAVKDQVATLNDAEKFENARLRAENERHELASNFQTVAQERKAVQQNYRDIQQTVGLILPPEMSEAARGVFFSDALRDIAAYAERNRQLTVNPRDIPIILAARMTASGIDPVKAAHRVATGAGAAGKNRSSGNGTRETKPATTGAASSGKAPQRTGAQMVEGAQRRRVAAAVPGAGAGAEGMGIKKPTFDPKLGTSAIDQAIEQHRKSLETARSAAH